MENEEWRVESGECLARPPPWRADHSREKQPIVFEDEPRMNTNRHEDRWTSMGATTLWDEVHPGARASRPHKSWHSLVHLLHPARPATAPGLCIGRAHAVLTGCPALPHRGETERNAAEAHAGGTPALPGGPLPITLAPQGGTRRLAGLQPCRCGRVVTLSGPSSSFVFLRG